MNRQPLESSDHYSLDMQAMLTKHSFQLESSFRPASVLFEQAAGFQTESDGHSDRALVGGLAGCDRRSSWAPANRPVSAQCDHNRRSFCHLEILDPLGHRSEDSRQSHDQDSRQERTEKTKIKCLPDCALLVSLFSSSTKSNRHIIGAGRNPFAK